ncbi:hypothetical protein [Plantactinospora sp. GCM10030261]|uniref:hypothetical protein n=1 Tax=Plantactinospora sp. GCM10030261 TaxID=3273420 RepID=UPI00362226CD
MAEREIEEQTLLETERTHSSTSRRRILGAGAAIGAGAVAASTAATPASAAPGDPVLVGRENDAGTAGTTLSMRSAAQPALWVEHSGDEPPLVLAPKPAAEIPQQVRSGDIAVTTEGDVVIGKPSGRPALAGSTRWTNITIPFLPQRVMDTRDLGRYGSNLIEGGEFVNGRGQVSAGRTIYVSLQGVVNQLGAAVAESVFANMTVTGTVAGGFLTAHRPGTPKPLASSLNWWGANQILSNLVEVQIGPHRGHPAIAINVSSATAVVVDVSALVVVPAVS